VLSPMWCSQPIPAHELALLTGTPLVAAGRSGRQPARAPGVQGVGEPVPSISSGSPSAQSPSGSVKPALSVPFHGSSVQRVAGCSLPKTVQRRFKPPQNRPSLRRRHPWLTPLVH